MSQLDFRKHIQEIDKELKFLIKTPAYERLWSMEYKEEPTRLSSFIYLVDRVCVGA